MASQFFALSGEFARLATFSNFQVPNGVWTIQLAKAGFCRNNVCLDHEVVCASCGLKIDVRTLPGQSVMELHRRFAPSCSFVADSSSNQQAQSVESGTATGGQSFSFGSPLLADTPQLPAYSSLPNLPDTSVQFTNGSEQASVPESDMPAMETQDPLEPSMLPSLPSDFLNDLQNATITSTGLPQATTELPSQIPQLPPQQAARGDLMIDGEGVPMVGQYPPTEFTKADAQALAPQEKKTVTYDDLGIVVQRPKRQDLATIPNRIATFNSHCWKGLNGEFQTKDILAEAGFYYAGYADCCRCFYCGGGLKNWEPEDHPWIEHSRWFKSCPYVLTNKGQDFVTAVESLDRTNAKILMADVENEMNRLRPQTTEGRQLQRLASETSFAMGDKPEENQEMANQLASENDLLKQQTTCKICLDSEVSILYIPCGHLVTCAVCAPTVKTCPVCRQRIKGQVRVQSD